MIVCKYLFFIFSILLFAGCQDSVNKTTWNKEDYLGKWGWKKTVKAGVAAGTTRMNIEFTEDGKYVMFWKSEPKDREARYAYTRTKEWKGTWDAGDFWNENTDQYVKDNIALAKLDCKYTSNTDVYCNDTYAQPIVWVGEGKDRTWYSLRTYNEKQPKGSAKLGLKVGDEEFFLTRKVTSEKNNVDPIISKNSPSDNQVDDSKKLPIKMKTMENFKKKIDGK